MKFLQNSKATHPLQSEKAFSDSQHQARFLNLDDLLYPELKQQVQVCAGKSQESLSIQVTRSTAPSPQNHKNILQGHKQKTQLHDGIIKNTSFQDKQTKTQNKSSKSRQSNKHNFPKLLVRKIKDLMKKILNIKKKAKLSEVNSIQTLFFYCFHQNLRKHENIQTLHLFLQHQELTTTLQKELQLQAEKYEINKNIDLDLVNTLRKSLRQAIIQYQQYLFTLIEKGQIGRKQEFIQFINQFLQDIKSGIVRSTHK